MNFLKIMRQVRGLSQIELAKRTGIANTWISKVEAGAAIPSDDQKKKIARVLGCQIKLVFPKIEEPKRIGRPRKKDQQDV